MNTVVLLGRTTAQLELKQTQSGKSVVSFSLAVKRPFTKDITDFYNVTVWDKQAELLCRYVGKGQQVCIRGHLTNSSWTDNQGQKHYRTDIVADEVMFVDSKSESGQATPTFTNTPTPNFEEISTDDDIPF